MNEMLGRSRRALLNRSDVSHRAPTGAATLDPLEVGDTQAEGRVVDPGPAQRKRRPPDSPVRPWHRVVFVLALAAAWEAIVRAGVIDDRFVSPPTEVVVALGDVLGEPGVIEALRETGAAVAVGYGMAAGFGVGIGLLLGLVPFLHRTFDPVVMLLFATPKLVLFPVFLLIFGLGATGKGAFAFSLGVFPVLLNVAVGAREVDPRLRSAAAVLGASRLETLRYVIIPSCLPSLLTGLRLGLTQTLLGVLLAELYSANTGVGSVALRYSQSFQTDRAFAMFALVAGIAVIANSVMAQLEHRSAAWREGTT